VTLQFGASLTDDSRSVNYDHNMFIIQATDVSSLVSQKPINSILQIKTKIVSCNTADSKLVKQEVDSTVILLPVVFTA
jgi:hypothetical protein